MLLRSLHLNCLMFLKSKGTSVCCFEITFSTIFHTFIFIAVKIFCAKVMYAWIKTFLNKVQVEAWLQVSRVQHCENMTLCKSWFYAIMKEDRIGHKKVQKQHWANLRETISNLRIDHMLLKLSLLVSWKILDVWHVQRGYCYNKTQEKRNNLCVWTMLDVGVVINKKSTFLCEE